MQVYREPLPENCPPAQAKEVQQPQVFFRMVKTDPPTNYDFDSARAINPSRKFRMASECQARGVSLFVEPQQAMALKDIVKAYLCCEITLSRGAGPILETQHGSHYTWWPLADFDILANCKVIREL